MVAEIDDGRGRGSVEGVCQGCTALILSAITQSYL